jgi:anti-sigma B factor antagonist
MVAPAGGLMQIEERVVGDVVVLAVTGEIRLDKGGEVVVRDNVRSLLHKGRRHLLIDLAQVPYVDSAGLGELVSSYVTAKNAGGALKLVHVTKRLKDVLTITKLVTVFETDDTETSALASFSSASV